MTQARRSAATAPALAASTPAATGAQGGHAVGPRDGNAGAPRRPFWQTLRAEALKFRRAAPLRLAFIMALPFPRMALFVRFHGAVSFSPWNYWYVLLMPVTIALVTGCVANADARMRNRSLLGLGVPLGQAWWAKALWCLALSALSNLVVLAIYTLVLGLSSGLSGAAVLTMACAAAATTVTSAWMIPAGLFLTARAGLLPGIFLPLAVQLVGGFAWSAIPVPQLFPPSATAVIPTAFIPVLPSGEPLVADMALGGALAADSALTWAGIAVGAGAFAVLTALSAAWFARSEEVR